MIAPQPSSKLCLFFEITAGYSVRDPAEFSNLLLLSASERRPLLTLWTASYCGSCRAVLPIIRDVIEKEGAGETDGGVSFAEVEVDAVGMGGLGGEYFVSLVFCSQLFLYEFRRGFANWIALLVITLIFVSLA